MLLLHRQNVRGLLPLPPVLVVSQYQPSEVAEFKRDFARRSFKPEALPAAAEDLFHFLLQRLRTSEFSPKPLARSLRFAKGFAHSLRPKGGKYIRRSYGQLLCLGRFSALSSYV